MKWCTVGRLGGVALQVCAAAAYATPDYNNCVARTDDGRDFLGHHQNSVCEWLGIPYAQAPVRDLRFAPPVKPLSSNGTLKADKYVSRYVTLNTGTHLTNVSTKGYDCPQTQSRYFAYPNATDQYARVYANFVNSLNNTQSEDCLTLNVWSKPAVSGLKPVLVWIYGGRFSAGTSNTPFYHGGLLADAQDVVVVTFNFRMNIFGFPGAPELQVKNLALLDQRLVVSWVRDNILAFGGDPSRITLAGQSSGSWAVNNWAYAFQDVGLVLFSLEPHSISPDGAVNAD